ncbi:MAG TPA: rod shape-determining protein MreC, partial [Steroidobacteraceae bacterium]|nr:rod shape-determining protein MreC [Steroidobacteraceae bacterium]
ILMSSELSELRQAKGENEELRKLLGLKLEPGWKVIAADIVGKTTVFERNMMTLSIGESSGVEKGMPVITDAGLVGKIYATSGGFSMAEGLFNTSLRVAVKTSRTRVDGIIAWEGGDELIVRNIPKALDIQSGDLVVTSEYSTFFPSDIPVGTVTRVEDEQNSLFRKIYVQPAAHPLEIEHCFVVLKDGASDKERSAFESRISDELTKSQKKAGK